MPDQLTGVTRPLKHYQNVVFDSSRWDGFVFRPDDIVISTPAKCGTTWVQMICALLLFGTPELPDRLTILSPWIDYRPVPVEEVRARLAAQQHRRFIKTHTPMDGVPQSPGVTYIVVGRDPRDVAVSFDHFMANLDFSVVRDRLVHQGDTDAVAMIDALPAPARDQRSRILDWLFDDTAPGIKPGIRDVVEHLADAWDRRNDPEVVLVHYADLSSDLEGQMRLIADRLGIEVPAQEWARLVDAARFHQMKRNAGATVPDSGVENLIRDPSGFFHSGKSEQWRAVLTDDDLARYRRRIAELASPDFVRWMHHGSFG